MANLQFPVILMILVISFGFFSAAASFLETSSVIKRSRLLPRDFYGSLPVSAILIPVYSYSPRGIVTVKFCVPQVFRIRTFLQVTYRIISSHMIDVINKFRRPLPVIEEPCKTMSIVNLSTEVNHEVALGVDASCDLASFCGTTARNSPPEKAVRGRVFQESLESIKVNEGLLVFRDSHTGSYYIGVT